MQLMRKKISSGVFTIFGYERKFLSSMIFVFTKPFHLKQKMIPCTFLTDKSEYLSQSPTR